MSVRDVASTHTHTHSAPSLQFRQPVYGINYQFVWHRTPTSIMHQISLTSRSFAGLMSRDINRAQGPPPTLSLPSPPLIRGALRLQPAERRAAQHNSLLPVRRGREWRIPIHTRFSPDRTSPRRDEKLPGCRDRGGSADRCVSAACFASCKFQHLGQRNRLLRVDAS